MYNIYDLISLEYDEQRQQTLLYFETGKILKSNKEPWEILNDFCVYHGSTLKGRMESAKSVLAIIQKPPVLVCLYMNCIFFPTHSYKSNDCIWIQSRFVKKVQPLTSSSCELVFQNGRHLLVNIGYRAIQRQLQLCKEYYDKITMPLKMEQVQEMIQEVEYG